MRLIYQSIELSELRNRAVHQGFRFLNENLSFAKFQEEGLALSGLAPRTTEVMR